MEVSGDIKANYDFSGGLGSKIKATENTNSPCQAEALFREVTRQNLAEVEVWIEFLCLQSEQEVKLKAHRFFINKKDLLQNQSLKVQLKYFTHQIKIIDLLISDLKLSDNKKK